MPIPLNTHGEILVAIDLCTREVSLWFLPDRKMEGVAKALLSGIIFQRRVSLIFVNDEAQEFVGGVVHSMNRYLGIKQITTPFCSYLQSWRGSGFCDCSGS